MSISGVLLVTRDADPAVSSEWPRPFDPAKPFNMLGVPGVSVEQRKRAEDLLLRALEAVPRYQDYQAVLDAGWQVVREQTPTFEHLVRREYLVDGRMLDPLHPESLVYKVRGGERTFVAYLFVTEPGLALDGPLVEGYAGRLLEWHNHSELCWQHDGENIGGISGFRLPDGSCADPEVRNAALDPRVFTGEAPESTVMDFRSFFMAHVWVVERICGPFSSLEGPSRTENPVPILERGDVCRR